MVSRAFTYSNATFNSATEEALWVSALVWLPSSDPNQAIGKAIVFVLLLAVFYSDKANRKRPIKWTEEDSRRMATEEIRRALKSEPWMLRLLDAGGVWFITRDQDSRVVGLACIVRRKGYWYSEFGLWVHPLVQWGMVVPALVKEAIEYSRNHNERVNLTSFDGGMGLPIAWMFDAENVITDREIVKRAIESTR